MFSSIHAGLAQMPEIAFPGLEKVAVQVEIIPLAACGVVALVMLGCVFRWLRKGSLLRRARAADEVFRKDFRASAHALALFQNGQPVPGSPHGALYMNACRELAFHLLGTDAVDKSFSLRLRAAGRITPSQWQAVQRASQRSLSESSRWLHAGLQGTGVRSLPGLGLLGLALALLERLGTDTLDMAAAGSAVRPLVLAWLFHVIGTAWHRRMVRRVDEATADLEDFSAELGTLLDRSFVDHRFPAMEALPSLETMGMADGPTFNLPPSEPSRHGVK